MRMIPDLQKWQWEQNWVCRLPWQLCGPGQWQRGPSSRRKRHHAWHFTRQGPQRSPIQRSSWFVAFFFSHEWINCWAKNQKRLSACFVWNDKLTNCQTVCPSSCQTPEAILKKKGCRSLQIINCGFFHNYIFPFVNSLFVVSLWKEVSKRGESLHNWSPE